MFGMSASDRAEMREIRTTADWAKSEITKHTELCAERQGEIKAQLVMVMRVQWYMLTGVITVLLAIAGQMFGHFLK